MTIRAADVAYLQNTAALLKDVQLQLFSRYCMSYRGDLGGGRRGGEDRKKGVRVREEDWGEEGGGERSAKKERNR